MNVHFGTSDILRKKTDKLVYEGHRVKVKVTGAKYFDRL